MELVTMHLKIQALAILSFLQLWNISIIMHLKGVVSILLNAIQQIQGL